MNAVSDACDLLCLDLEKAERLRSQGLTEERAEALASRARVLSDPTRLTLATALGHGGELCVCDLSWITGRSQGLVSHHVRALRNEGLARSRRDGKMVLYELTPEGVHALSALATLAGGA